LARDPERTGVEQVLAANGREAYVAAFAEFRKEMSQRWRSAGAGYTEVVTSVEPSRAVRAVVMGLAAPSTPLSAGR
jgi:hypothetical protein